ncbi:leucine-rich repeat receptor-like tyrosine-protein kinase PXC3 [Lycium barbarum]|uniref:leucine-rich repeat receptor-like tyrosine-protein kinase PXC3 n=1 Tax=Lycium barbarum TaxID=112863 RepID=UPI00293F32D6|nr:leucine-rich repeat receptor-like tyrosine-protein kinase PXC3 [Lycium barbarum]
MAAMVKMLFHVLAFSSRSSTSFNLRHEYKHRSIFSSSLKARITSDPNRILSTNWSSSTSVCNWIGITCGSRHRRVTALNISDLRKLSIATNDFKGFIPNSISNLKNLRFLSMNFNYLEGNIPIEIATLQGLKVLALGYNSLNGSNALAFLNISSLENLDLENAGLTGALPSDLCRRLPRLQKLNLNLNMLNGEIPRSIVECSELQLLLLMQNNLVGTIPRELGNLQLLQNLDLGKNRLEVDSRAAFHPKGLNYITRIDPIYQKE